MSYEDGRQSELSWCGVVVGACAAIFFFFFFVLARNRSRCCVENSVSYNRHKVTIK